MNRRRFLVAHVAVKGEMWFAFGSGSVKRFLEALYAGLTPEPKLSVAVSVIAEAAWSVKHGIVWTVTRECPAAVG